MSAKKVWGSQPGKERGALSNSEKAYLRAAKKALDAGGAAALDPRQTEANCPVKNEDFKRYWLEGFRIERQKVA